MKGCSFIGCNFPEGECTGECMACCNGDCYQGRRCPVRQQREETLGEKILAGLSFIVFMVIMVLL